ncbi:DUF7544 domain-containing protein [Haloferacaceae archaeon DSL9]
MSWYAIDAIDEAIGASRRFLFPFRLIVWLKLAAIAFFLGGGSGGSANVSGGFSPDLGSRTPPSELPPVADGGLPPIVLDASEWAIIGGIVLFVVGLSLFFSLLTELARFVFYDALRRNDVALLAPARDRFGQAVRLLGFKLAVSALTASPAVLLGTAVYLGWLSADAVVGLDAVVLTGLAVVFVALVILSLLLVRFTNEFVAPIMTLSDAGVVASWKRLWPTLAANWTQFLVYLVVHVLLAAALGIAQTAVAVFVAGVLVVAGILLGLPVIVASGGVDPATMTAVGILFVLALVVVLVAVLFVVLLPIRILVLTYLTAYELSVLAAANERFRLLPRPTEPAPTTASGG